MRWWCSFVLFDFVQRVGDPVQVDQCIQVDRQSVNLYIQ